MPGREYVLGVQANLWTEYIPTAEQAEYIQRVAQQTVLENLTLLNIKR